MGRNPGAVRRLMGAAALALAAVPSSQTARLYDDNPAHLWNRLHAALFVRVASDGREYGGDRVDPLLWVGSTYLLEGAAHDQGVRLLNEFVDAHAEQFIHDPLKRAILQRDLWTLFDWLNGDHTPYQRPDLTPEVIRQSTDELRAPLATVISRLALTPEEIRALPDNYASATRATMLPPDLLASDGRWVSVGRPDGPVAVAHVRDSGPGKNSVFLVLIRLPGARSDTLRYLEALRSFSGPLWRHDETLPAGMQDYPNPQLPRLPVGTRVALVRRALLIDSAGRITATRLTEQVQLRAYQMISPMTAREFADAQRVDESMFERAGQLFEEFSLSRAALFGGRMGGLLQLAALNRFFITFSSQGVDVFDVRRTDQPNAPMELGWDPARAKFICKDCHAPPGVYSFNSFMPFRLVRAGGGQAARLAEISLAEAERTAIAWKEQRADWVTLQSLLRH